MIAIRNERISDFAAREALLDRAYGPARFTKTSARLREDRLPAEGLSFVATERGKTRCQAEWAPVSRPDSAFTFEESARSDAKPVPTFADRALIGTVRLWSVSAGPGRAALLLGPLGVDPACQGRGIGAALMQHAIAAARKLGHRAVLLVGDAPYYGRFGFSADATGALWMPGPYEQARLLALELVPGALTGARGLIGATGAFVPKPDIAALVAAERKAVNKRTSRAA